MKVALIGCGQWGKNLARVFHELGALEMVCDLPGRLCEIPELAIPVVRGVSSIDEVLNNSDITAVAIATPAETHFKIARAALGAGKDVFIEKPMTLSVESARRLDSMAEGLGRILMVGHIMEYHPAVVELIRQVRAGELGEILQVYATRLNRGRIREHESCLWSFAPHDVAVLLRMMDMMPEKVTAEGNHDSAMVHMEFGGIPVRLFVNWLYPFKESRLVVMGSVSTVGFNGFDLVIYRDGQRFPSLGVAIAEPLRLECQEFLASCGTREPPLTDGESGVRVLEVLERAQRSMDRG